MKVSLGAERGLLMKLRAVERELADLYRQRADEDTYLHRVIHSLQSRHADALMTAEEAGYERGLRDGRKEDPDGIALRLAVDNGLHLAVEESVVSAWPRDRFYKAWSTEPLKEDPYAATRTAITRAVDSLTPKVKP